MQSKARKLYCLAIPPPLHLFDEPVEMFFEFFFRVSLLGNLFHLASTQLADEFCVSDSNSRYFAVTDFLLAFSTCDDKVFRRSRATLGMGDNVMGGTLFLLDRLLADLTSTSVATMEKRSHFLADAALGTSRSSTLSPDRSRRSKSGQLGLA